MIFDVRSLNIKEAQEVADGLNQISCAAVLHSKIDGYDWSIDAKSLLGLIAASKLGPNFKIEFAEFDTDESMKAVTRLISKYCVD